MDLGGVGHYSTHDTWPQIIHVGLSEWGEVTELTEDKEEEEAGGRESCGQCGFTKQRGSWGGGPGWGREGRGSPVLGGDWL